MNILQNSNIVYINTLQKQDTDNVLFYMNINGFEIVFWGIQSLLYTYIYNIDNFHISRGRIKHILKID